MRINFIKEPTDEGTYGSFKTSLLFERIKKWINTSLFGKTQIKTQTKKNKK
jgi:hypothetical protein